MHRWSWWRVLLVSAAYEVVALLILAIVLYSRLRSNFLKAYSEFRADSARGSVEFGVTRYVAPSVWIWWALPFIIPPLLLVLVKIRRRST
jgi:hypothetical protein